MERIGQMEPILADYISQQFPGAEVDFLPNIDNIPQPQVMQHIKSCDVIAVQSIFDKEFDATFEKMIALFSAVPSLRKPVYAAQWAEDSNITVVDTKVHPKGK